MFFAWSYVNMFSHMTTPNSLCTSGIWMQVKLLSHSRTGQIYTGDSYKLTFFLNVLYHIWIFRFITAEHHYKIAEVYSIIYQNELQNM